MPERSLARFAPLTGAAFVVLTAIAFIVAGEPPDFDAPASEVIEFYRDHEGANVFGSVLLGLTSVLLIFFSASVRRALRRSEDGSGVLSAAAFGSGIVAATGFATGAAIHFALTEFANSDGITPGAVQALNALDVNFFFPFGVGIAALVLATGLAALRTRVIPIWLAWVAVVLFVVSFTPIGFVGFLLSGLWIIVVSILLWRAEERAELPSAGAAV
jgi:hypothetical protein